MSDKKLPRSLHDGMKFLDILGETLIVINVQKQGRGFTVIFRSDKSTLAPHLFSGISLTEFKKRIVSEVEPS